MTFGNSPIRREDHGRECGEPRDIHFPPSLLKIITNSKNENREKKRNEKGRNKSGRFFKSILISYGLHLEVLFSFNEAVPA